MKTWLLRIWQGILIVLVTLLLAYRGLVMYGIAQLEGQLHVVNNARELTEVLEDPNFPDSVKVKLGYVQEIRRFAEDSLGLTPSDNYSTVFDQKGKPILWLVTAAEPYAMEPYTWKFPLLGEMGYKGFFDMDLAEEEIEDLKEDHLDVGLREVTSWSTLGFFRDPILTNFLSKDEGQLANLIIHEMTHGTLFVPDSTLLNENLANFVGDEGARRYLKAKYGNRSEALSLYEQQQEDAETFIQLMLQGANQLDSLYSTFQENTDTSFKRAEKQQLIGEIMGSVKKATYHDPKRYNYDRNGKPLPNNTYFLGIMRYHAELNQFEKEFKEQFNENFKAYFSYLKERYPSI